MLKYLKKLEFYFKTATKAITQSATLIGDVTSKLNKICYF